VSVIDFPKLPRPILDGHPEWVELYHKTWELAASHVRTKHGQQYMDAAWDPARNYQWVWDTSFMTLYCRYAPDQYPGIQSLDNFYRLQRDDGYISMCYDLNTGREPWPDRVNPPLFAWAEWEYYRSTGDDTRLHTVVPHIERLMHWIDAHRRTAPHRRLSRGKDQAGNPADPSHNFQLYYFSDCGSSGMDDSPRAPRVHAAGQHYDWIDLSSQMALSFQLLGRMHTVLGDARASARWQARAGELGALINEELWCERTRFYHDRMLPKNFVAHKTAAAFWPLLADICSTARRDALVDHLLDGREFNRPTPVPTLSADDLNYTPEGIYWTGGVWAPTNYMITRGLMNSGRHDIAHAIAMKYIGALARTYAQYQPHTLWECYSPEADRPGLAAYTLDTVKPDFVGWTGLGPIAMLIENVIGLDVDAPHAEITWDLRLTEAHGVENLALGKLGTASLLCKARSAADDPAELEVTAESDLSIRAIRGDVAQTIQAPAGATLRGTV